MQIYCKYDELVPLSKLKPNPRNSNIHSDEQIKRLAKLYGFHGIRHPIIVSKLSGYIVVGHARAEAALSCKMESFPVVYQEFESPEQEESFAIADNAIAEWSEISLSMVNEIVPDLGPDFDIDVLGIKDFKLDADFLPGDESDQSRLDKTKLRVCPNCGHEFTS